MMWKGKKKTFGSPVYRLEREEKKMLITAIVTWRTLIRAFVSGGVLIWDSLLWDICSVGAVGTVLRSVILWEDGCSFVGKVVIKRRWYVGPES